MQAPTAPELLETWQAGRASTGADRARRLLAVAERLPPDGLDRLSVGTRDARLLELRSLLFGDGLAGAASCEACDEPLEFTLSVAALPVEPFADDGELELRSGAYRVRVRPPTVRDLDDAAARGDETAARALLLERSVVAAERDGASVAAADLPVAVAEELGRLLAEREACADIRIALVCPACGHAWEAPLDVAAWVWAELDRWARLTLDDVDVLARAYGWTEAEVLALGARRQAYLELAAR